MKIFMFFLLFFASPPLFAQATFKVMTYNVENFFDTRIIQPRMTMNFYLPATGTGHKAATIISYNK